MTQVKTAYSLAIRLKSGDILHNTITHPYSADDLTSVLWAMVRTSTALGQPVSVAGDVSLTFDPDLVEAIIVSEPAKTPAAETKQPSGYLHPTEGWVSSDWPS